LKFVQSFEGYRRSEYFCVDNEADINEFSRGFVLHVDRS